MALCEERVLVAAARWEHGALTDHRVQFFHRGVVPAQAGSGRNVEGHGEHALSRQDFDAHRSRSHRVEEFTERLDRPLGAAEPVLEPTEMSCDDLLRRAAAFRPLAGGFGGLLLPQVRLRTELLGRCPIPVHEFLDAGQLEVEISEDGRGGQVHHAGVATGPGVICPVPADGPAPPR